MNSRVRRKLAACFAYLSDLEIRPLFGELGGRNGNEAKIDYIWLLNLHWFCGCTGLLSSTCFELDRLLKFGIRALIFDETVPLFRPLQLSFGGWRRVCCYAPCHPAWWRRCWRERSRSGLEVGEADSSSLTIIGVFVGGGKKSRSFGSGWEGCRC